MLSPYYTIKDANLETLHVFKSLQQAQNYLHTHYEGTPSHEGASLTTTDSGILYVVRSTDTLEFIKNLGIKHLDPQIVDVHSDDFQKEPPAKTDLEIFANTFFSKKFFEFRNDDDAYTLFKEILNDFERLANFWSK